MRKSVEEEALALVTRYGESALSEASMMSYEMRQNADEEALEHLQAVYKEVGRLLRHMPDLSETRH